MAMADVAVPIPGAPLGLAAEIGTENGIEQQGTGLDVTQGEEMAPDQPNRAYRTLAGTVRWSANGFQDRCLKPLGHPSICALTGPGHGRPGGEGMVRAERARRAVAAALTNRL